MTEYDGGCHCGSIGFHYRTDHAPSLWSIRACQCSFCRAHDALSTSDPTGKLEFFASRPANLERYRFGLRTADFLLCRECGVYIGAFIETGNGAWGIINTRSLGKTPDDVAAAVPADYDSETTTGRVGRREERWTPAISAM